MEIPIVNETLDMDKHTIKCQHIMGCKTLLPTKEGDVPQYIGYGMHERYNRVM